MKHADKIAVMLNSLAFQSLQCCLLIIFYYVYRLRGHV